MVKLLFKKELLDVYREYILIKLLSKLVCKFCSSNFYVEGVTCSRKLIEADKN